MKSIEFENLEEARYLFSQSVLINGRHHPTTEALDSALTYRFDKWVGKASSPNLTDDELNEKAIEALHQVIVDQQGEARS